MKLRAPLRVWELLPHLCLPLGPASLLPRSCALIHSVGRCRSKSSKLALLMTSSRGSLFSAASSPFRTSILVFSSFSALFSFLYCSGKQVRAVLSFCDVLLFLSRYIFLIAIAAISIHTTALYFLTASCLICGSPRVAVFSRISRKLIPWGNLLFQWCLAISALERLISQRTPRLACTLHCCARS